jgi:hypothetical protein
MANFCGSCGSPAAANKPFCPHCGTPQQAVPPATPRPQAAPAPAKGSSAGKILLILFVGFLALVTLAGAGIWYAAHKIKQAAVAKAHELGVELPSGHDTRSLAHLQVCEILSVEQASALLGKPVQRSEKTTDGCLYFGAPGASAHLADDQFSQVVNHSAKNRAKADNEAAAIADAITNLASAAGARYGIDAPLLTVIVSNDGRTQMAALSASRALFKGIPGATDEVPNLGDRAFLLANLGLNVLAGERLLRVVPGPVPSPKEKSMAVAQFLLPKI